MSRGTKHALFALVLICAALGAVGYLHQTQSLRDDANATTPPASAKQVPPPKPLPPASDPVFAARAGDIVLGKAAAPVTVVEYASLSCPHCAHFFKEVLPDVKKEFLDTGKAKLVFREFPLNAQALRGGQLVECADPSQREHFVEVLFEMQEQWAYTQDFLAQLKQIAGVGGIDAARFQSCMDDKKLEDKVLASRQEAVERLNVNSTPTFFVGGKELKGETDIRTFRTAISAASAPAK
ncbi:MAG: DsbA family protein [Alphaproteobacteria bacterium]